MHTMLIWKMPFIDNDLFLTRKPAAFTLICFEDKHFQSTLGKMQGGGQPRDARANNDDIIVFGHCDDYMCFSMVVEQIEVTLAPHASAGVAVSRSAQPQETPL